MPDYRVMTAYHIGQWLAKMYVGERESDAPMVAVPGWSCQGTKFEMPCQWAVTN